MYIAILLNYLLHCRPQGYHSHDYFVLLTKNFAKKTRFTTFEIIYLL